MPQTKTMQVGQREQLRAPEAVERWVSKSPRVVSVTDEDVVHGHAGGEIVALALGRARVQAIGFENHVVVDVEITVEGRQPVAVAAGQTAQLDPPPGGTRWVSRNPQVAEVDAEGQVRGVSPGITCVQLEGSSAEMEVRVAGTLEIGVNQRIALAERIAVPVRGWRLSSTNVAAIDDRGTLTAGDQPRTVTVAASLASGDEFSFDVRIRAAGADRAGTRVAPAADAPLSAPGPSQSAAVLPDAGPAIGRDAQGPVEQLNAGLGQAVETHLSRAEGHIQRQQWDAARSAIVDADLITLGHSELKARVQQTRGRLERAMAASVAAMCHGVVSALRRDDYGQARAALRELRLSKQQTALLDQFSRLTDLLESLGGAASYTEDQVAGLYLHLEEACRTALGLRMPEVVAMGAEIAVDRQVSQIAPFLAEALGSRLSLDVPGAVRASLRASLIQLKAAGFEAIVDRLARTASGDPAGPWLLDALADMDPAYYAGIVVRMHRAFEPDARSRLVGWLCKMGEQSCDVLLALIGGTLKTHPVDRSVAEAVRKQMGADRLEKAAIKWWTLKRVPGADLVLRILYGYASETLSR